jgi:hypothetical protein
MLTCFICWSRGDSPTLSIRSTQPSSAFTPDRPPVIELTVGGASAWRGFIRVKRLDLLSEKTSVDFLPADAAAGQTRKVNYAPDVPFGVYQLDCAPMASRELSAQEEAGVLTTFAYAPARAPSQLPNDWPLGAHVTLEDPPLPGFKWYRYFSSWAQDNPAQNRFDWSRLDVVFARVRSIGGRLLIANDTTPAWTAPEKPVTRPWVVSSTAYPPDDMGDLRAYLDALLQRFDNPDGTLGALEVWNEANTPERWQGTPQQMVQMGRIFRAAVEASGNRVHRALPARIVGIAVSSGDAKDYVRNLVNAGILPCLDVVSGHWYEEMLSYDPATPINSLPRHVDLLAAPLREAGFSLPIWNTESGIGSVPRENGRIVSQDELNRRAMANPAFDPKQPWLVDGVHWRGVSERRAAASFVAGTAMLMSLGVEKTFVYSMRDEGWIQDGAPSLSWVSLAEFGQELSGIDFHCVTPVKATIDGAPSALRVLAYRFGSIKGSGVTIAWVYRFDATVGRPKLWQAWLPPQPVRVSITAREIEVSDLYGRERARVSGEGGVVAASVGEEPVYFRELP